ncbi:MAG: hypothetical protein MHM6MM_006361 [Cercozoa sp. M6MM]
MIARGTRTFAFNSWEENWDAFGRQCTQGCLRMLANTNFCRDAPQAVRALLCALLIGCMCAFCCLDEDSVSFDDEGRDANEAVVSQVSVLARYPPSAKQASTTMQTLAVLPTSRLLMVQIASFDETHFRVVARCQVLNGIVLRNFVRRVRRAETARRQAELRLAFNIPDTASDVELVSKQLFLLPKDVSATSQLRCSVTRFPKKLSEQHVPSNRKESKVLAHVSSVPLQDTGIEDEQRGVSVLHLTPSLSAVPVLVKGSHRHRVLLLHPSNQIVSIETVSTKVAHIPYGRVRLHQNAVTLTGTTVGTIYYLLVRTRSRTSSGSTRVLLVRHESSLAHLFAVTFLVLFCILTLVPTVVLLVDRLETSPMGTLVVWNVPLWQQNVVGYTLGVTSQEMDTLMNLLLARYTIEEIVAQDMSYAFQTTHFRPVVAYRTIRALHIHPVRTVQQVQDAVVEHFRQSRCLPPQLLHTAGRILRAKRTNETCAVCLASLSGTGLCADNPS